MLSGQHISFTYAKSTIISTTYATKHLHILASSLKNKKDFICSSAISATKVAGK